MTEEELKEVISRASEGDAVDFKGPINWIKTTKNEKLCLIKDFVAFANGKGGHIVVGVSEDDQRRPIVEGLSPEDTASWETTDVTKFLNGYVDPPIPLEVVKPSMDSKSFVVIRIPPFSSQPHLFSKDSREFNQGDILVRNKNAESSKIKTANELRELIRRAVIARRNEMLADFEGLLHGTKDSSSSSSRESDDFLDKQRRSLPSELQNSARWEVWACPSNPDSNAIAIEEMRTICLNSSINRTGWPFLYVSRKREETFNTESGIRTIIPHFSRLDVWELKTSGLFFHATTPRHSADKPDAISLNELAIHPAGGIETCVSLLEPLDPTESVTLGFKLVNVEGFRLSSADSSFDELYGSDYKSMINEMTFEQTATLAEWRAGMKSRAVKVFNAFVRNFNYETRAGSRFVDEFFGQPSRY